MNVLVTGGSGFIGSHVVDALIDNGHNVKIFDLKPPYSKRANYLTGSILDRDTIKEAVYDMDIIYHFAGFSNIDKVEDNPLETIRLNIIGTANLLDRARIEKIDRFILASSVYVYEESGHLYTYSKQVAENLCKQYEKLYGLPFTILRLGTAYGPRSRAADVISIFVQNAIDGTKLEIKGSGTQERNFIYVTDIANASVKSLAQQCTNKILTIAAKKSTSINELSVIIKNLFKKNLIIENTTNGSRELDYSGKIIDVSHTYALIHWVPKYNINKGISKYVEWLSQ